MKTFWLLLGTMLIMGGLCSIHVGLGVIALGLYCLLLSVDV